MPAPGRAEKDEDAVVLDATVKEMSEKLSRLSSSLEAVSNERASFEEKVERMEERMRKLSSLTEMLSAQYNPFVGDAPSERAPLKANNAGAMAPLEQKPAKEAPRPAPEPEPEPAPAPGPFAEDAADVDMAESGDHGGADPLTVDVEADAPPDATDDAGAEPAPREWVMPGAPHTPRLDTVDPGFMTNMLLLNWSNMLLKATHSRDGMRQVVEYYHGLGWIGESVRDALLAYANGLACEEAADERDWRSDVELHERSLLFIEKLKGGAP